MGLVSFDRVLALTGDIADATHTAAWGFLAAVAVLALCFASFRAMLLGDGRDAVSWGLHLLVAVGCLSAYDTIVGALISASEGLTDYFAERAGWNVYWQAVAGEFRPLFEQGEDSGWDRLVGWMRGGVLTAVVSVSYYFEFMVFHLVQYLAAVFVGLLNILGPLLIAASVLVGGKTVTQWLGAMVQVLLWPVVPPFLMLVIVQGSANAIETGNVSFIIGQNLILAFLGLMTPFVVLFIVGRCGVDHLGAAIMAAAILHAKHAAQRVAGYAGSMAQSAYGHVRGGAASAGAQPPPITTPRPRPDDAAQRVTRTAVDYRNRENATRFHAAPSRTAPVPGSTARPDPSVETTDRVPRPTSTDREGGSGHG